MNLKYNIEDKPPKIEMFLYGIQWLAVTMPIILIIGNVVGNIIPGTNTVFYIQSLFLMIGLALLLQISFGHKLPTILGPATVLLIAVLATMDQGMGSINFSFVIGGVLLSILAFTGAIKHIQKLFTSRVIIVILLLIAFTLTPTILNLILVDNGVSSSLNYVFVLASLVIVLIVSRHLKGLWNSTLPLWILLFGSAVYYLIFNPTNFGNLNLSLIAIPNIHPNLAVPDIGIILAFIICFLALTINDIGSIQSIGSIVNLSEMEKRIKNGLGVTGIMNVFSGIIGVIGPVNYSMTPGVIAATSCSSRHPLYITGTALILIAFSPFLVAAISLIPSPIISVVLIYIMTAQIGAAILLAKENNSFIDMDDGIIVGLPIILATIITFLPDTLTSQLPLLVRPLLCNAFVMGVIFVLLLEHFVFKNQNNN